MTKKCVLMFSGGRDSSLAAIRLAQQGFEPILLTITSSHLVGIQRVRERLRQLQPHLPSNTRWINISQPRNPVQIPSGFSDKTCLPCQQAYVLAGYRLLHQEHLKHLALGYASYQGDWPEQTIQATTRLRALLEKREVTLQLPVYDLKDKNQAVSELGVHGLSIESLEQKCTKQVTNIALHGDDLIQQLDLWESLLSQSLDEIEKVRLFKIADICLSSI